jgi:hypothetical protein
MKVKELIKMLEVYEPDEELCVLYWDKEQYGFVDDPLVLTDGAWSKVVKEFDAWDNAGADVTAWINDAVIEHAEVKDE